MNIPLIFLFFTSILSVVFLPALVESLQKALVLCIFLGYMVFTFIKL